MTTGLKEYLFAKHILVNESGRDRENCFPTLFALAGQLGIRITEGAELALPEMIRFSAEQLGLFVPEPFYRGFPERYFETSGQKSVCIMSKSLSASQPQP